MSESNTLYGVFINGRFNTYIKYVAPELEQIKGFYHMEMESHKHSRHNDNTIIIIAFAPGEEIIPTYEWSLEHKVNNIG